MPIETWKVVRIGNSRGVRLPARLLAQYRIRDTVEVECTSAGDVRHESFDATFVRVESVPGSLVRVSGQGRSLLLGRHLRPHLRETLVGELRRALRDAVAVREAGTDE